MTLSSLLSNSSEKFDNQVALELENCAVTFSELDEITNAISHELRKKGITNGDRVAHFTPTSLELIYSYLANFKNGSIVVPINSQFKEHEVLHILSDSGAKAIVTDQEHLSLIEKIQSQLPDLKEIILIDELRDFPGPESLPRVEVTEKDIAAIFYTSGTTGKPKGAALNNRNITSNLATLKDCWEWRSNDVVIHTLPLYHVHGFIVALLGSLLAGSKIILKRKFDAEDVLQSVSEKRATMFFGVPTMYFKLVEAKGIFDLSSMRLFISGSAPLSKDLFQRFKNQFGFEILERAGMTETLMNFSNPVHGKKIPGSVGKPLKSVAMKIVDEYFNELPSNIEGEILLKGENVFCGYWNNPEATEKSFKDGWFCTGDVGKVDDESYVYIIGRKKDVIKSGGILIFPKEIEEVIEQMPQVKECAVIGIPNREFGESVKACVVTCDNGLTESDVIEFCKSHLASFKKPKQVEFFTELPKNSMGKILKEKLRQMS